MSVEAVICIVCAGISLASVAISMRSAFACEEYADEARQISDKSASVGKDLVRLWAGVK